MKRRWLRILGGAVLLGPLLLFLGLGGWSYWRQREVRQREATELWLQNTVIPEIDWQDQTLAQCVQWLDERLQSTPGHPRGLHIRMATAEETARYWRRQVLPIPKPVRSRRLENVTPTVQPPPPATITRHLFHTPFQQALVSLYFVDGGEPQIEARRILIYRTRDELGTLDPLVAKTFRWDPAIFQSYYGPWGEVGKDLRPFLTAQRLTFYEGCSAEFDPKTGVLHLRSTQGNIRSVETLIDFGRKYSWWERVQREWTWQRQIFEDWLHSPAPTPAPGSPSTIPGLDPAQP